MVVQDGNGEQQSSISHSEWLRGANPIDLSHYWMNVKTGHRISQGPNDLLKAFGLSVSGGLIRSACRAGECSAAIMQIVQQNSTLTRCTSKNPAGVFFPCADPDCVDCPAPSTNHLDSHFLTTRAGNQLIFSAVQEYDLICNGRGHDAASLTAALAGTGYKLEEGDRVDNVPVKYFAAAGFGRVDLDLTISAGANMKH